MFAIISPVSDRMTINTPISRQYLWHQISRRLSKTASVRTNARRSWIHRLDHGTLVTSRDSSRIMQEAGYLIRPRQPRREIHLQPVRRTKWRFVGDISSWNWLHPPFTLRSARYASPFPRNSRPSRRSIRKVKLLSEINYLLIRGWRPFVRPLSFYGSPIFSRIRASVNECQLRLRWFYVANKFLSSRRALQLLRDLPEKNLSFTAKRRSWKFISRN